MTEDKDKEKYKKMLIEERNLLFGEEWVKELIESINKIGQMVADYFNWDVYISKLESYSSKTKHLGFIFFKKGSTNLNDVQAILLICLNLDPKEGKILVTFNGLHVGTYPLNKIVENPEKIAKEIIDNVVKLLHKKPTIWKRIKEIINKTILRIKKIFN